MNEPFFVGYIYSIHVKKGEKLMRDAKFCLGFLHTIDKVVSIPFQNALLLIDGLWWSAGADLAVIPH
jgi:hypothetical protein